MDESSFHQIIQAAVVLKRMVPNKSFSLTMALVCAGYDHARLAEENRNIGCGAEEALKLHLNFVEKIHGPPSFSQETRCKRERFQIFVTYAKCWPSNLKKMRLELVSITDITSSSNRIADAMRLVGFEEDKCSAGDCYQACKRVMDGRRKKDTALPFLDILDKMPIVNSSFSQTASRRARQQQDDNKIMPPVEECEIHVSDEVFPFSPLSQSQYSTSESSSVAFLDSHSSSSFGFLLNHEERSHMMHQQEECSTNHYMFHNCSFLKNTAAYQTQQLHSLAKLSSQSSQTRRKTTKQAHDEKLDSLDYKLNREMAYKIGTILMSYYKDNKLPAYRKMSPIDLVAKINAFFGLDDYVTTREISMAVKKNHIGQTPPRRGTKGRLPEGTIEALADLFFSFNAMCQYNGEKILTRPEQIALLQTIVDDYFEQKTPIEPSMNARVLFSRIEEMNAYQQHCDFTDERDLLRFVWFTSQNITLHYDRYEQFAVEKGFARRSSGDELQKDGEQIKWYEDQKTRGMNWDEMRWSFDYSKNGQGGRPPTIFVANKLQNVGEGAQKSSYSCSIMFGVTYNNEALPPLIILPSTAEYPRIREELVKRLHQIEGRFGHDKKKYFDCMIATSPKGSMTGSIMNSFVQKLALLYPDVKDEEGYRLFLKLDSGPGRDDENVLHTARANGIYVYPGVPNTSEGTQECDQLFSYLKTLMESNRRKIFSIRSKFRAGSVSVLDLPFILFGGVFDLPDGTSIELPNAFEKAFSTQHIMAANFKCGYCPANRNALLNEKCRRILGDKATDSNNLNEKGIHYATMEKLSAYLHKLENDFLFNDDDSSDEIGLYDQTILSIEEKNKIAVGKLQGLGFCKASLALKTAENTGVISNANSITYNNIGTKTKSGTRERQELLSRSKKAGQFFTITGGGDALNCDDMLIAMERTRMQKKADKLQKLKDELIVREKVIKEAKEIMKTKGGPILRNDFVTCLKWKTGKSKITGTKIQLMEQWKKVKNGNDGSNNEKERVWTNECDRVLSLLRKGDISVAADTTLFKRAMSRKCYFINEQVKSLDEERKMEILLLSYAMLTPDIRRRFKDEIESIDKNGGQLSTSRCCLEYSSDDEEEDILNNVEYPPSTDHVVVADVLNQISDGIEHEEEDDSIYDEDAEEEERFIDKCSHQHQQAIASSSLLPSDTMVPNSSSDRKKDYNDDIYASDNASKQEGNQEFDNEDIDNLDAGGNFALHHEEDTSRRSMNNKSICITSGTAIIEDDTKKTPQSLDVLTGIQKEKEWDDMSIDHLIKECRLQSIQADKRYSRKTLVKRLQQNKIRTMRQETRTRKMTAEEGIGYIT
jgi:hypothetical protein